MREGADGRREDNGVKEKVGNCLKGKDNRVLGETEYKEKGCWFEKETLLQKDKVKRG